VTQSFPPSASHRESHSTPQHHGLRSVSRRRAARCHRAPAPEVPGGKAAIEIAAVLVGMIGAVALVLGSAYVLIPRRVAFSVNAQATLAAIKQADDEMLDDEDLFHETMILTLAERHDGNAPIVDRLNAAYATTLLGLLLELVGLGLVAALAS
jgi:hypothetical protein